MIRPYACHNPYQNSPFISKDKLAGAASTKGSGISMLISDMSCVPTSAPVTAPIIAPSLNNKQFTQFIKAYLEAQVLARSTLEVDPESCK